MLRSTLAEIGNRPYDGTRGEPDQDESRRLYLQPVRGWDPLVASSEACDDVDETVLDRGGWAEVRGSCNGGPPIRWLERVSNLVPTLTLQFGCTTGQELYEEWFVRGGDGRRVKLEICRWTESGERWVALDPDSDQRDRRGGRALDYLTLDIAPTAKRIIGNDFLTRLMVKVALDEYRLNGRPPSWGVELDGPHGKQVRIVCERSGQDIAVTILPIPHGPESAVERINRGE